MKKNYLRIALFDMKRNTIFFMILCIIFIVYLMAIYLSNLNNIVNVDDIWTNYVMYGIMSALTLPLLYYSWDSNKNRQIITSVVNTKLQYPTYYRLYLISLIMVSNILIFIVLSLLFMIYTNFYNVKLHINLIISLPFINLIINKTYYLFIYLFENFFLSLIVYLGFIAFMILSRSAFFYLFHPIISSPEITTYWIGKLSIIMVLLLCIILAIVIKNRKGLGR